MVTILVDSANRSSGVLVAVHYSQHDVLQKPRRVHAPAGKLKALFFLKLISSQQQRSKVVPIPPPILSNQTSHFGILRKIKDVKKDECQCR
jgi:hypothetical protein